MCNNNGICSCFSGNNWWWIIILILLLCNCGGNNCGYTPYNGNGCYDNNNNCGCC